MVQQLVDQWYFDILFPRSIYTLDDGTGRSRLMRNHCRYKNEQLDLAEQKGGSSNVVDLTRRPIWPPQILSTWYVAIFELLKYCQLDMLQYLSSSNVVDLTPRSIWAHSKSWLSEIFRQQHIVIGTDLVSQMMSTSPADQFELQSNVLRRRKGS